MTYSFDMILICGFVTLCVIVVSLSIRSSLFVCSVAISVLIISSLPLRGVVSVVRDYVNNPSFVFPFDFFVTEVSSSVEVSPPEEEEELSNIEWEVILINVANVLLIMNTPIYEKSTLLLNFLHKSRITDVLLDSIGTNRNSVTTKIRSTTAEPMLHSRNRSVTGWQIYLFLMITSCIIYSIAVVSMLIGLEMRRGTIWNKDRRFSVVSLWNGAYLL